MMVWNQQGRVLAGCIRESLPGPDELGLKDKQELLKRIRAQDGEQWE